MHKTRHFLPPMPSLTPGSYDLYSPRLRFAILPRESLHITGDFEALTRRVLEGAMKNAGRDFDVPEGHIAVPVHELQVSHILDKFKEAIVYPEEFSVCARAQQSVRYIYSSVSFLSSLLIRLGQVSDSSRNLTRDAPETWGWDQTNFRGSHNIACERVSRPSLLRTSRSCLTL
jgi:hypothetical protein